MRRHRRVVLGLFCGGLPLAGAATQAAGSEERGRACRIAFALAGGSPGTAVALPIARRMILGIVVGDFRSYVDGLLVVGGGAAGGAVVGHLVGQRVCHRGTSPAAPAG